jgi:hypothetical protein
MLGDLEDRLKLLLLNISEKGTSEKSVQDVLFLMNFFTRIGISAIE